MNTEREADHNKIELAKETERILIVDDEPEVAKVLSRALAHAGYEVSTANDAKEALERLKEGQFSLLLSDIHMPGMHGDELQRVARERDPHLAVILITAAGDVACAVDCMREGVFDYIIKPAPLADVSVRVGKALERGRITIELENHQATLEQRVAQQADRIRRLLLKSLQALTNALEAKDENTRDHSLRVSELSTALAKRLRPDDTQFHTRIGLAGIIHDIGKIGVPEAILNKPGRLDPEEFAIIQKHPVIGETILRPLLEGDEDILAVVRHHHERWDGRGYPDGLAGGKTPLGARITAVADGYDAMRHARAYREGMPLDKVLQILRDGAGSQWDDAVVKVLLGMAQDGSLERLAKGKPVSVAPSLSQDAKEIAPGTPSGNRGPVVPVRDLLDPSACEKLRARVELLMGRGNRKFVLDLSDAELEALGASLIHELAAWTRQRKIRMTIRNASPAALAQLENVGAIEGLVFEGSSTGLRSADRESRPKAA